MIREALALAADHNGCSYDHPEAALDALVAERDRLQGFAEFCAALPLYTRDAPMVSTKEIARRARAALDGSEAP